jgi:NADH:ubiquinone oxidoreductase subunit 5 (subunit L)/multisubunit Na+/H+ antiporter MnhA subunit
MGIGVGSLGLSYGMPAVAILGFAGGLLHVVNHALFKSLLFLGAGAVYRATGTRNMEALGGLARRMPLTWLSFAIGSAAIVGLPPFNGFVSEWLVYQGLFSSGDSGDLVRLALLGMPALALTGGLALACFAKVGGIVFLGNPRTAAAAAANDVSRGAQIPMIALALACVTLGVAPSLAIALVSGAARELAGLAGSAVPAAVISAATAISGIALLTAGLSAGLWWIRAMLTRHRAVRREATWACGFDAATPRMQYTSSSFAAPLLGVFDRLSGVHVERRPHSLRTHARDLALDGVALPVWHALYRSALRLRTIQHGRLHVYLLYVMGALLVMLAYLGFGPR